MLKMGLRVSEFCALTMQSIDLDNMTLTVNKQLQYRGKNHYWIEDTKTVAGNRIIPIPPDEELVRCFELLSNKPRPKAVSRLSVDKKNLCMLVRVIMHCIRKRYQL